MLKAYCDASVKEGKVAIAGIVATNKMFIDYDLRLLEDVTQSVQGELRAVIMIFEMINTNFEIPQDVIVFSDCTSVVKQFASMLKYDTIPQDRIYHDDWVKLKEVCSKHNVTIKYIRSHSHTRSYHTICDYSARALIQRSE